MLEYFTRENLALATVGGGSPSAIQAANAILQDLAKDLVLDRMKEKDPILAMEIRDDPITQQLSERAFGNTQKFSVEANVEVSGPTGGKLSGPETVQGR